MNPIQKKIIQALEKADCIDTKFLASEKVLDEAIMILQFLKSEALMAFEYLLKKKGKDTLYTFMKKDQALRTFYIFLHNLNNTDGNENSRKIIESFQVEHVEYESKISLHKGFYEILKKLLTSRLSKEEKRSLELMVENMEHSGVHLPEEKKKELESIQKRLSELSEKVSQNIVDSRKVFFHHFTDDKSLQSIPKEDLDTAKKEASKRKLSGWVFTLSPPSYQAIIKYCTDRDMRKKFLFAASQVASSGEYDNRPLVLEILKKRKQQSTLLGHNSFAEYVLQQRMAGSVEIVENTLNQVATKSRKKAEIDIQTLKEYFQLSNIEQWDTAFYSEQYKKELFALDDKELKPYFSLHTVKEGVFSIAQKLFDIKIIPLKKAGYHASVEHFEVWHGKEKTGYLVFDLFARESKRPGAWCNDIRERIQNTLPVVFVVCNFPSGNGKTPPLLTHYDVLTLFHECGHALHVLLGKNTLPNVSGFHTEWDFVELPSQILENWAWEQDSLSLFAKHYISGEKFPKTLLKKLQELRTFMSGYQTLRQNEFSILDLSLHTEEPPQSVEELDKKCFQISQKNSLLPKYPENKNYASFSHIFDGGYAAGYYSYLWAEILEADIFKRFKEEGLLKKSLGKSFAKTILSKGALLPAKDLFHSFMRREPQIDAYLEKIGL